MEITQRTYMEVIEGRADLLSADDPKAFLFGVARRVAASMRRRRSVWGRIMRLQLVHERQAEPFADPESEAGASRDARAVREAMGALADRQREVVTLVFTEGNTVEEAAKLMGVSVGSARTHYHRGKRNLARMLEELSDDG